MVNLFTVFVTKHYHHDPLQLWPLESSNHLKSESSTENADTTMPNRKYSHWQYRQMDGLIQDLIKKCELQL